MTDYLQIFNEDNGWEQGELYVMKTLTAQRYYHDGQEAGFNTFGLYDWNDLVNRDCIIKNIKIPGAFEVESDGDVIGFFYTPLHV
jgi:hypothetical protein